jgi:hypothetical protein
VVVAAVVAGSFALVSSVASSASAQSASDLASARALYKEARELRDKGDAKGALEKFKAANALAGTPITALELGRTYAALGQPVEALETWLSVARMKVDPKESDNAKSARAEAASLAQQIAPKIPSLVVKVDGVPSGATPTVTVDGASVPVEALGLPRKVDPGEHVIVGRLADGPEEKRTVTVKESESQTVTLSFAGAPAVVAPPVVAPPVVPPKASGEPKKEPPPLPPSPQTEVHKKTNPIVYIGFGVGAAGLVVGTVGGLVTFSQKGDLDPLCTGLVCDPSARKIVTNARTWATVSTIGFVVGGVGIAAGVVGLLMPSKEIVEVGPVKARLHLDPSSVGLTGTF